MSSRRAVVAMAVIIPILLGVSALAYASVTATGANPDDNNNNFLGTPRCTVTVSLPEVLGGVIQNAINMASPGAVICVSAGVYPEQLTITKALTLEGLGTTHNPTEIQPTTVVQNSADPDTNTPEYDIILVGGGVSSITGVTISNLVVDGSLASSTFNSCADDYDGILFLNAGGMVTGSTVQNVYLPVGDAGCQPGLGIEVQTGVYNPVTMTGTQSGDSSSVTISNNQVLNYNKNGITCNDAGTTCDITQNTVTFYVASAAGAPSTSYTQFIAPNGVQVAFGAVGTVSDNTVSGNLCNDVALVGTPPTPTCGPNYVTQTQSAGILTYQSGKGTTVSGNTVSDNDIGILTSTDAVTISNNVVQNNRFEGMYLNDGTYTASNNQISCGHADSCDIGLAVVSDGFANNPTTVTLNNNFDNNFNNNNDNNFNGAFACSPLMFTCAPLQAVAYTGAPSGGTYNEPAILTINGFSETITAGSSATPSFVNLTSFPSSGPFYP